MHNIDTIESEVSKMIYADVRDKAHTARGAHYRNTKGSKPTFQYELLKGKERKKYMEGGEVKVSNTYDTIMSYEEFMALDLKERRKVMLEYVNRHTNQEMITAWGRPSAFYDNRRRLINEWSDDDEAGLTKTNRKRGKSQKPNGERFIGSPKRGLPKPPPYKGEVITNSIPTPNDEIAQLKTLVQQLLDQQKPKNNNEVNVTIPIRQGFNTSLSGVYDGKMAQEEITDIIEYLRQSKYYRVLLMIEEVKGNTLPTPNENKDTNEG